MSDNKGDQDNGKLLYCSFCGKSQHEVRKLIAGPSVFICDECVELCNDIIREELVPGRTGIAIKTAAESRAADEGIDALVYSHAQGNWVHDAGIWMVFDWPERYGAHPRFPLRAGEWISLEFSVTAPVPEWDGQEVTIMREEDTLVHGDGRVEYLSGPQQELWVIR